MELAYTLYGRPRCWTRPRSNGARHFTPQAVLDAQAEHREAARLARPAHWPMDAPVTLAVEVHLVGGNVGDLDNYAKLVMDALQGEAYANDRQVVGLRVRRHRHGPNSSEENRTDVRVVTEAL